MPLVLRVTAAHSVILLPRSNYRTNGQVLLSIAHAWHAQQAQQTGGNSSNPEKDAEGWSGCFQLYRQDLYRPCRDTYHAAHCASPSPPRSGQLTAAASCTPCNF
jgi:hypothetical protein